MGFMDFTPGSPRRRKCCCSARNNLCFGGLIPRKSRIPLEIPRIYWISVNSQGNSGFPNSYVIFTSGRKWTIRTPSFPKARVTFYGREQLPAISQNPIEFIGFHVSPKKHVESKILKNSARGRPQGWNVAVAQRFFGILRVNYVKEFEFQ